ncbi:hypothetical protein PHYPO_G00056300 [Pangasianodon hypophthalmus]|uniref:Uncharacterized protein n=1 Tax=Pangasianodon hypophthalmus TaxID=310915 RepID=A0A5N5M861_PANHP|nr:hypothetical protein PHYPO_G00056300 [Pangasianodon hypophthalmus]
MRVRLHRLSSVPKRRTERVFWTHTHTHTRTATEERIKVVLGCVLCQNGSASVALPLRIISLSGWGISSAAGGFTAPHRGASVRPDCVQGRTRHPQLQGRGPAHAHGGVVQGWREGRDRQRRLSIPPHAAAHRLPLLLENSPWPPEQTGRRSVRLRGPQLPRGSRES